MMSRHRPRVKPGIDRLASQSFSAVAGRRLGVLSHSAAVDTGGRTTIEVLCGSGECEVRAVFSPEHGYTGTAQAEEYVKDHAGTTHGPPVYSLYGERRRPEPEMLRDIDVMVIDLQDIGVRSYTYISCMALTIEACLDAGVAIVILDRPNPLGGLKVDGPVMDRDLRNYLGYFPIPYVYGLTIGELALMAAGSPGWLRTRGHADADGAVRVVPMEGWQRSMRWADTGLQWHATSPNIRTVEAAEGYAMTGLGCQIGGFRHGYGSDHPFRALSHPDCSPRRLKSALRARRIPGLSFGSVRTLEGRGAYVKITDWDRLQPTELSFHLMQMACEIAPGNPFSEADEQTTDLFNLHTGSESWRAAIARDGHKVDLDGFLEQWRKDADEFRETSRRFWLYPS